jgi:hypothetical protein
VTSLDYAATAREFDMPYRTVVDVVKRLAGDDLAEIRRSIREDLMHKAFRAADNALNQTVNAEYSNAGFAAKAYSDLVGTTVKLDPKDKEQAVASPTINVYAGMIPPASDVGAVPQTENTSSTQPLGTVGEK